MLPPPSPPPPPLPKDSHNTPRGSQSTFPSTEASTEVSTGARQPTPPPSNHSQENLAPPTQDQTSRTTSNQARPTSHALESAKASAIQTVEDRTRPLARVANFLDSLASKVNQIFPATAFAFHIIHQCAIDLTHALALNKLQVPANFPKNGKVPPALAPQLNQRSQATPSPRPNIPTLRSYSKVAKATTLTPSTPIPLPSRPQAEAKQDKRLFIRQDPASTFRQAHSHKQLTLARRALPPSTKLKTIQSVPSGIALVPKSTADGDKLSSAFKVIAKTFGSTRAEAANPWVKLIIPRTLKESALYATPELSLEKLKSRSSPPKPPVLLAPLQLA